MVVDYDELIYSLEAVERIAKSIEDQFFDLSSIGPSVFFVLLKCRIPDDHISQRRYPWFVARDIMYHAIEQFIQQAQGGQST